MLRHHIGPLHSRQYYQMLRRIKKKKYLAACEEKHTSFTPVCSTIDGLIGSEAKSFIKRLVEQLSPNFQGTTFLTLFDRAEKVGGVELHVVLKS